MSEVDTTTSVAGSRAHPPLVEQEGKEPSVVFVCLQGVGRMLLYSEALWRACMDLHDWNRAQAKAYKANGLGNYCAANWSFVVSRQTSHPLVGTHFNEACCDAWGGGPALHKLFAVKGDKNPTMKMRSTILASQPRLHIRIEGAEAKIAALLQKASGQRALKLQQVRDALKKVKVALNGPHFANDVDTATVLHTIAALVNGGAAAAPVVAVPVAVAAALPALPVAAAAAAAPVVVPSIPLQTNGMVVEEKKEDGRSNVAQSKDDSKGSDEQRAVVHDEAVAGRPQSEGMEPAAAALAKPTLPLLASPSYGPLPSPVFLIEDEPFSLGLPAVDCASVNGALFGASSPSRVDSPTAGIYAADAHINDFDTPMKDEEFVRMEE